MLIASDGAIAIVTAILGVVFVFGRVEIAHVYAAILLRAVGNAVHTPAMLSTTPLLVPEKQLTRG